MNFAQLSGYKRVLLAGGVLGLAAGYALAAGEGHAIDWRDFRAWTLGLPAEQGIWNPYWGKLILGPLAWLPAAGGHFVLNLLTLAAVLLLTRRAWPLLASQTHGLMWYGNLDGLMVAGMGAARNANPYLVGLGLLLLSIKPQYGPLAVFYAWRCRDVRLLAAPLLGFLLSLLVFGNWLPEWLALLPPTPKQEVSVSLGLWAWPVWLLLPVVKDKERFTLLATALTMPYFNNLSLFSLFAFAWPAPMVVAFIAAGWLGRAEWIAPLGLFCVLFTSLEVTSWTIPYRWFLGYFASLRS